MSDDDFDKFDFENEFGDKKKKKFTKNDKIYGIFNEDSDDDNQVLTKEQIDNKVLQMLQKRQPSVNFFDNPDQPKQKPLQEYQKKQAFNNFKKASTQLEANKGTGVKVHFGNIKKKKTVSFNLELNQFHSFQKDPDENLTQIEKFQLSRKIQMFQRGMHVSSDEEEDFQNVIDDTELRHQHTQDNEKEQHLKQLEKQISQHKRTFQKSSHKFQATHKKHQKNQKTEKVFQETTEIGFQLLKQLGYTGGGLGKYEQGRIEPVEAVKKNAFKGMGNIQVEFEEVVENEQEEEVTPKMTKQQKKLEKMWKKRKNVEKTIEPIIKKDEIMNLDPKSILQNIEKGLRPIQNIGKTDYSQPEYKEMEFIDHQPKPKYDLHLSKQAKDYLNLVQQIKLKVQDCMEKELNKLERQEQSVNVEKNNVIEYTHEIKDLEDKIQQIKEEQNQKINFLNKLNNIQRIEDFEGLYKYNKQQFLQFNVQAIYVQKILNQIDLSGWDGPLENTDDYLLVPEFERIKNCCILIKDCLIYKKSQSLKQYSQQLEDVVIINSQISGTDVKLLQRYIGYLIDPILKRLRTYIINMWNPLDQNALFEFLIQWTQNIFTIETDDNDKYMKVSLIEEQVTKDIIQMIIPKLERLIQNWTFKPIAQQHQQLHCWAMPWITSKFQCKQLLPQIIARLNQSNWSPNEPYGFQFLTPWAGVLGDKWNDLVQKSVIPKLLMMMIQIQINPQNQDISDLKQALMWTDFLGENISMVFERLIMKIRLTFEQWHKEGDKQEIQTQDLLIFRWLNGWQKFLGPKVLSRVYKLQHEFDEMKSLLTKC
ncbi:hypothetical protein pb186bvf_015410 [Paramecium bursaria]